MYKILNVKEIILDYTKNKLRTKDISLKYNIHRVTVQRILKRNGVELRYQSETSKKYKINEKYFNEINSSNKGYILGLLFADGSHNIKKNNIEISLMEDDVDILKKIIDEIYIDSKELEYRKSRVKNFNGKLYTSKPQYRLIITNKNISKKLNNIGLVQNKSLILKYPNNIPSEINKDFIRGYFDGDGCISKNKKTNNMIVRILGTENFLNSIAIILDNEINVNSYVSMRRKSKIYQLSITGNSQITTFMDWLYNNSEFYLQRKRNKYKLFKTDF